MIGDGVIEKCVQHASMRSMCNTTHGWGRLHPGGGLEHHGCQPHLHGLGRAPRRDGVGEATCRGGTVHGVRRVVQDAAVDLRRLPPCALQLALLTVKDHTVEWSTIFFTKVKIK